MAIDTREFDQIARTIFKPVYPLIAEQILHRTGIRRGTCLDIGCGGGYLGLALLACSELNVHFLDASPEMLEIVQRNVTAQACAHRTALMQGDVGAMPLPDNAFQLAVSRGSIFFWPDLTGALREIDRVLAPGGCSYIGGGFGSAALKEEISRKMEQTYPGKPPWRDKVRGNLGSEMRGRFEESLKQARISDYSIIQNEEEGLWIVMRKPYLGA